MAVGRDVKRLYTLDASRALAALAVVLFHWQHFRYTGLAVDDGARTLAAPLSGVFGPIYREGWLAVDYFFVLSGFVFYWTYGEAVASGLRAWRFAAARIARLWPLHLLTLGLTGGAQALYRLQVGEWFVVPHYDAVHLLLNVVGAAGWSRHIGWSWNAPFWSVSVEAVAYLVFYAVVQALGARGLPAIAVAAAMAAGRAAVDSRIATGISLFFIGGVVCRLAVRLAASVSARCVRQKLLLGCVLAVGLGAAMLAAALVGLRAGGGGVRILLDYVVFPYVVFALALLGMVWPGAGRALAGFGDMTYAIYLLHFPLQVVTVTALSVFALDRALLFTAPGMACFLVILLALSRISYVYFECPARRWVRERLTGSRAEASRA